MTENIIYAIMCFWGSSFCWLIYWLEGEALIDGK